MEFCTSTAWREILEQLILPGALARVNLGPKVIEIGPGPGFTTEYLLRSATMVTAVEIDPLLAAQLRENLAEANVDVVVSDAGDTSLDAASHTGGASFHMLHHVASADDQNRIFAELARVVRPGGAILLVDSSPSDDLDEFHKGDIFNPIDAEHLSERLSRVGFIDVVVEHHDLGWSCTARVPGDPDASVHH
jgi:SAM-dependent methyltransferase